jgi:hypothetical protein
MVNYFFKSAYILMHVKHSSRVIFSAALLLSGLVSFAQINAGVETVSLTTITFLNPGVKHEQKTGKKQTLCVHAYMATLTSETYSGANGFNMNFYLEPALNVQYRFYYNASKRAKKGKSIQRNSMNYISPLIKTEISKREMASIYSGFPSQKTHRPIITSGLVWGLQRNYSRHFSLDINFGAGYLFVNDRAHRSGEFGRVNTSGFTTVGQVSLGFWLNKRNRS